MDGDLQNAPEDLPRLIAAVEEGADVASGTRTARRDSWGRTLPSRVINGMLRRFTRVDISDFGCAFNAYRRSAIEPMLGAIGKQKFTKALVLSGGASVAEVDVSHTARAGQSRYSPLRLTRLALRARGALAAADPVDRDRARCPVHDGGPCARDGVVF
jgi:undecaprenyl-phosphate 4-deoxy-4-formamido-L-arabinose transferase